MKSRLALDTMCLSVSAARILDGYRLREIINLTFREFSIIMGKSEFNNTFPGCPSELTLK